MNAPSKLTCEKHGFEGVWTGIMHTSPAMYECTFCVQEKLQHRLQKAEAAQSVLISLLQPLEWSQQMTMVSEPECPSGEAQRCFDEGLYEEKGQDMSEPHDNNRCSARRK